MKKVHALVIGVGGYPRLDKANRFGLEPLMSPAITANKFAAWLRDVFSGLDPDQQLGEVIVLASCPDETLNTDPAPTIENIRQACLRWVSCCHGEDNLGIFYFCGHGLYSSSHFLLCDGFGDPAAADEWLEVIDFELFRAQLDKLGVNVLSFIDTCAQESFYPGESFTGQGLISAKPPTNKRSLWNIAFYAAARGNVAIGHPITGSHFSEAVMECLTGLGATNWRGTWEINGLSLATAIFQYQQQQALDSEETYAPDQSIVGTKATESFMRRAVGAVKVRISLLDARQEVDARASIELSRGEELFSTTSPPLRTTVETGVWNLAIRPEGESPMVAELNLWPPIYCGIAAPLLKKTSPDSEKQPENKVAKIGRKSSTIAKFPNKRS